MKKLSQTLKDFVAQNELFKGTYSKALSDAICSVHFGLGLPVPSKYRKEAWGYVKEDEVFYPVDEELKVLLRAYEMADSGNYYVDDVVTWLGQALPSKPVSRRNFFYIKQKRPVFPELRLDVEQRIKLANGLSPASAA